MTRRFRPRPETLNVYDWIGSGETVRQVVHKICALAHPWTRGWSDQTAGRKRGAPRFRYHPGSAEHGAERKRKHVLVALTDRCRAPMEKGARAPGSAGNVVPMLSKPSLGKRVTPLRMHGGGRGILPDPK